MAVRTKSEFEALYGSSGSIFPDNTTGEISAEDQRNFGQDIADSFITTNGTISGVASGTDTYAVTLAGVSSYAEGDTYVIEFTNANTGAATININSLGAKSLVKTVSTALAAGNISAGQAFVIYYDGTNFQVLGVAGSAATVNDTAFATSWDGDTTVAPSKNTVYDAMGGLKVTSFDIGDWNMDTDATVQVSLPGSLTADDLRAIDVFIRNDANTSYYKLDKYDTVAVGSASGWVEDTASQIKLRRRTGGDFDNANFDSTTYNRGWITVWTVA
jgi:hypothetical protein